MRAKQKKNVAALSMSCFSWREEKEMIKDETKELAKMAAKILAMYAVILGILHLLV